MSSIASEPLQKILSRNTPELCLQLLPHHPLWSKCVFVILLPRDHLPPTFGQHRIEIIHPARRPKSHNGYDVIVPYHWPPRLRQLRRTLRVQQYGARGVADQHHVDLPGRRREVREEVSRKVVYVLLAIAGCVECGGEKGWWSDCRRDESWIRGRCVGKGLLGDRS